MRNDGYIDPDDLKTPPWDGLIVFLELTFPSPDGTCYVLALLPKGYCRDTPLTQLGVCQRNDDSLISSEVLDNSVWAIQ